MAGHRMCNFITISLKNNRNSHDIETVCHKGNVICIVLHVSRDAHFINNKHRTRILQKPVDLSQEKLTKCLCHIPAYEQAIS